MKYFFRLLFIVSLAFGLSACTDLLAPDSPKAGEVPFTVTISMADRAPQTKSIVSGRERVVHTIHTMQLVCFDANGLYLGIRNAEVTSNGPTETAPHFFDTGIIKGTVPQGTSRIHFIANRNLSPSLSHNVGTPETEVMNSLDLSTSITDKPFGEGENAYQEICYWGYHKEASADIMNTWLNPNQNPNTVYLIRDRARVILQYDATGAQVPVTKIEWLIHNSRDRGYLAPVNTSWTNDGYYKKVKSKLEGHTDEDEYISIAGMNEYTNSGRHSLWISEEKNDENNFDVAYQNNNNTLNPQFLFDDDNTANDDLKVIMRVTYTVNSSSVIRYHVLRLNDDDKVLYDIVRNNTYYIKCKLLSPDVAYYETLKDAVNGDEFVNAETEVDRTVPDINNETYTLQIKLPNEGTSIVLNTVGEHSMDYVFRMANDVSITGSTDPEDFEVYWEKSQTFCDEDLDLSYNNITKQFTIKATVLAGQLKNQLQDEWIVVKHKASGLTRYIHIYVIDQFRYKLYPTLTAVSGSTTDYVLSFQLPPMEHTKFLEDGSPDPNELIYPETLYPIDVKFTTNTLKAYGTTEGTTNYGLFGVSVEGTSQLCTQSKFEKDYGGDDDSLATHPISSTSTDNIAHWYFQQADNYWDFWYTYSLKTYPTSTGTGGVVNIYFKDVRNHITYATVDGVGLFLYVEYFGKYYSVPVTTATNTNP